MAQRNIRLFLLAGAGLTCLLSGHCMPAAIAREMVISDGSDVVKRTATPQIVVGLTLDDTKHAHADRDADAEDSPDAEADDPGAREPGDAIMDGSDVIRRHKEKPQEDGGMVTLVIPDHDRHVSAVLRGDGTVVEVTFSRNAEDAIVFGTVWRGAGRAADHSAGKKAVIPVGMTFSTSLKLDRDDAHPEPITIPGGLAISMTMLSGRDAAQAGSDDGGADDVERKHGSGGEIGSVQDKAGDAEMEDVVPPPPQSDGIHHSVMRTKGY